MLAVALTPMTSRSLPNTFVSASGDKNKTFFLTTENLYSKVSNKLTGRNKLTFGEICKSH